MLSFFVGIRPMPTPRIRIANNGYVYNPAQYTKYLNALKFQIELKSAGLLTPYPVKIDLTFYRKLSVTNHLFGDIDNLVKGVMDAMTGTIYQDDKQVTEVTARKAEVDNAISEGIWIIVRYSSESSIDA